MAKIIATHFNPDLDAICAVWLVRKYLPAFKEVKVEFVAAGETYKNLKVDENENIIHVDTGMGKFDHHQLKAKTCAAKLVFNYLKSMNPDLQNDQALIRLIEVVEMDDHFEDCLFPNATADYYNFHLASILDGLKSSGKADDYKLIEFGSLCLEGIYNQLKKKIKAEKELKEGIEFSTAWGKAIGCLTKNDEVLKLGQKMGYVLAVQKNPQTEQVRIKARPDSQVDLTELKNKLEKLDPQATWFLHINKKMLLNGSSKNPKMKPSNLSLKKIIDVLEILE